MDFRSLPPEIIWMIIDYLPVEKQDSEGKKPLGLAHYSTISRDWQGLVERRTFSRIRLTPGRLQTALTSKTLFDVHGAGRHRLASIRQVDVAVILPGYDEEARRHVESDADRAANNAVFTSTILGVFELLARGHAAHAFSAHAEVQLSLSVHCPTDVHGAQYMLRERRRAWGRRPDDILRDRYNNSYIELHVQGGAADEPATGPGPSEDGRRRGDGNDGHSHLPLPARLPRLPMITSFTRRRRRTYRHIDPVAMVTIASRLPRLHTINWSIYDGEKRDLAGRRARRAALGRALVHLPPSLANVRLSLQYSVEDDRVEHPIPLLDGDNDKADEGSGSASLVSSPPSSSSSSSSQDPLSTALGRLARRTRTFTLSATLITKLFWTALASATDDDNDNGSGAASPPALTSLVVTHNAVAPTGKRLSLLPPREPDFIKYDSCCRSAHLPPPHYSDDLHYLPLEDVHPDFRRVHPDPASWSEILHHSGRAVAHLPNLRHLQANIGQRRDRICEATYRAASATVTFASYPPEPSSYIKSRMTRPSPLSVPGLFQPDADVLKTWQESIRTQLGIPDTAVRIRVQNITSEDYRYPLPRTPLQPYIYRRI